MDFTTLPRIELQFLLEQLSRDYVQCIDDDRLEDWPKMFVADGLYEIISRENVERGLPAHAMRCDGAAMMRDRVISLRQANVYGEQRYRHIVSGVNVEQTMSDAVVVHSNYLVARTLTLVGDPTVLSVGKYLDVVVADGAGLKFKQRRVVFDNERVHSLLALPI